MDYILIDDFNGSINIICKDDGSGEPLIFENFHDAETALDENCQNGIIVPMADSIGLLKRINSLFDSDKLLIEEETAEDKKNFIQLKNDVKELFDIF
jgi:hypothetical protein